MSVKKSIQKAFYNFPPIATRYSSKALDQAARQCTLILLEYPNPLNRFPPSVFRNLSKIEINCRRKVIMTIQNAQQIAAKWHSSNNINQFASNVMRYPSKVFSSQPTSTQCEIFSKTPHKFQTKCDIMPGMVPLQNSQSIPAHYDILSARAKRQQQIYYSTYCFPPAMYTAVEGINERI